MGIVGIEPAQRTTRPSLIRLGPSAAPDEVGLSRKTVEAKLTRLFDRYGALSRTELAVRAQREGWLDL